MPPSRHFHKNADFTFRETLEGMKKRPRTEKATTGAERPRAERALVRDCLEALREIVPVQGREREVPHRGPGPRPDTYLDLRLGGHEVGYVVEVKRGIRGPHVGPLAHHARQLKERDERLLVCADRIPNELGEQLREQGVAYLDLGGNAYLRAPGLYILIAGRPPAEVQRGRQDLTGTEVRLLGVFLRDPDAGEAVQTELAKRAGIALGAVGRGREKLVQLGILDRTGKRRWLVRDRAGGLRRFAEGWAAVVRHKLRPRNYRMVPGDRRGDLEDRLTAAAPELGCLLGGERAAGHLTRFLRTDHATLHVPPGRQQEVARALMLVPDKEGPVTLLERYGRGDEYRLPELPGILLAHPLLVWAECLTVPDERVAQTAGLLYDERLVRAHE